MTAGNILAKAGRSLAASFGVFRANAARSARPVRSLVPGPQRFGPGPSDFANYPALPRPPRTPRQRPRMPKTIPSLETSSTGSVSEGPLSTATSRRPGNGHEDNADLHAARNILASGIGAAALRGAARAEADRKKAALGRELQEHRRHAADVFGNASASGGRGPLGVRTGHDGLHPCRAKPPAAGQILRARVQAARQKWCRKRNRNREAVEPVARKAGRNRDPARKPLPLEPKRRARPTGRSNPAR